jgi:hypothetical protein
LRNVVANSHIDLQKAAILQTAKAAVFAFRSLVQIAALTNLRSNLLHPPAAMTNIRVCGHSMSLPGLCLCAGPTASFFKHCFAMGEAHRHKVDGSRRSV